MLAVSSHPSISFLVHPCDKADKGGCERQCVKKGEEEFICACPLGFQLNYDGKKCDNSKSIHIIFIRTAKD